MVPQTTKRQRVAGSGDEVTDGMIVCVEESAAALAHGPCVTHCDGDNYNQSGAPPGGLATIPGQLYTAK